MELKKTPKADLENKRNILVQIGLVVSLGIVLTAFSINSTVKSASSLGDLEAQDIEDEVVPITRQEEIKPPPPPPPPKVIEVITIVEDDVEIEEEFEFLSSEADDETIIDAVPVIEDESDGESDEVFAIVEEMPEFPGGDMALLKYISDHMDYPAIAVENGIKGKVYVYFVIDENGNVTDARIARGVDPSLDKEALRVINTLPRWKPGKQRGKPVKVSYNVPINFQLQ